MIKKMPKLLKKILCMPWLDDDELLQLKKNKPVIDNNIQVLLRQISSVYSADSFFLEPDEEFYNDNRVISLQAKIIADKIGLSWGNCLIDWGAGTGAAGIFQDRGSYYRIRLDPIFKDNRIIVSGILAHELTHLYFDQKGLSGNFGHFYTEECCCDLSMFLLGLGKIVLNSIPQTIESGIETKWVSNYWSWFEMCYAYEKVNLIKGIPEEKSRSNLNRGAKALLAEVTNYSEFFND